MTAHMLIVDDDRLQLHLLASLISLSCHEVQVLMAESGVEAIAILEDRPIDMVLTDLQMPDMNGFELLAWLASNQPRVVTYAMTAYSDSVAIEKLNALGDIECFTKPIDVEDLIARVSNLLSQETTGHVRNIGLPSFLQLLQMERKTCSLTIRGDKRTGSLALVDGELIDARTEGMVGVDAALAIIGWPTPSITIVRDKSQRERTVEANLGYLIMEAMRLADEGGRPEESAAQPSTSPEESAVDALGALDESPDLEGATAVGGVAEPLAGRVIAVAHVDVESGALRTTAGSWAGLEPLATFAAHLHEPAVEEVLITGAEQWVLGRPLPEDPSLLTVAVFEAGAQHVIPARRELERWSNALPGSGAEPPPTARESRPSIEA